MLPGQLKYNGIPEQAKLSTCKSFVEIHAPNGSGDIERGTFRPIKAKKHSLDRLYNNT